MSDLGEYEHKYRNIAFERRDGVLEMRLHLNESVLQWGALEDSVHAQLGPAFYDVSRDDSNRVVILTGTGESFCERMNGAEMPSPQEAEMWSRIMREGREMLMNLLAIGVPVIGAVNGPALIHAELLVLSDVVIASDTASFADHAHFPHGVVPGDGVQVVWPMLIGINRARYFLLTGQVIGAQEALALGVVNEVLPANQLRERAWVLGQQLAAKPLTVLRNTRAVLTQAIRQRMLDELGAGLALEGLAMALRLA